MEVINSITDLIGKTPILNLKGYAKEHHLRANLFGKLESFNPGGSVKDRVAKAILKDALERKVIDKYTLIIEPTSGNTGIGLALTCASLGLKLLIVMPDTMSLERRSLLRAYGAQLQLTQGSLGMKGAIERANEIFGETENAFMPSQFDNLLNPKIHYISTGPEIYNATDGKIDFFVAGIGTGGTITGVGQYLKSKNKDIQIIGVEPKGSPVLTKGVAGHHKIQGIGAGFIPKILDTSIYDEVIDVSDADAFEAQRDIAKHDGVLAGISSGAAVYAANVIASRVENAGKNIVVMLPDTGERYLSTQAFLD